MISSASAWDVLAEVAGLALPPERISVPEAAERNVILDVKGGYYGEFKNSESPLMVEPAECLTSRDYDAVIMVSSAQSAKTQCLVDNWAFHTICCNPVDFLMVEKSEGEARKHSKTKFDRIVAASPNISSRLARGHGNNVHEKRTKSGAYIWIKWPTKNTLSGTTVSRIALTDYDRMEDDIDGEGSAFDLAYSRRTYFGTRGMVLAESSPSRPIIDPKWTPSTPHEAPPTGGILGLYNTGDRRRVYSRCPHCGEWINPEASPDAIHIPDDVADEYDAARRSSLICRANGCLIGMEHEATFKKMGRWVREWQTINEDGSLEGDGRRSRRATFWMPGWFAPFTTWESIIAEYLMAKHQFARTGDEESVKGAVNTKIGGPYWTNADLAAADGIFDLSERTEETWGRWYVPEEARVLTALVDVQKRSFQVGIIARGPDNERWILDRYGIWKQKDAVDDIRPAIHVEHWKELTTRVVLATYRLPGGLEVRINKIGIDSGGEPGTTERAYEYWRSLPLELKKRVFLLKGVKSHGGNGLSRLKYPDSRSRKDRPGGGKGDVPVLEIISNRAKDAIDAALKLDVPGRNFIHIPGWISSEHLQELQSEKRNQKGEWQQIGNRRNELWDHLYYEHGIWDHLTKGDRIDWEHPPSWAADWEINSNVLSRDQRKMLVEKSQSPRKNTRALHRRMIR